jgi:SAM-dependent methyltransferase
MTGHQAAKSGYVIRGGAEGRERLRLLAAVMRPYALSLFDRLGVGEGMACLDVGCGGGDVTLELARLVGAGGNVVGTDLDGIKLEIARTEARERGFSNVEFVHGYGCGDQRLGGFDLVFARFLLTHVPDPRQVLQQMHAAARPGATLVAVDIDFSGYFCYPDCPALWKYVRLYTEAVKRRGGDANIGYRLPELLGALQLEDLQMNVFQPAGWTGGVKQISPLTMEYISEAVVAEGLASRQEIDPIVAELYAFAERPDTVLSGPRCFEVWGRKPAA